MPVKVTKEKFIQALENNEDGLTNEEISKKLGISVPYFYELRRNYRKDVRDRASEMAQTLAVEQIQNLRNNAKAGDTAAAVKLLEIGGAYIPASLQKLEVDASNLGVIVVPERKEVGAPVAVELQAGKSAMPASIRKQIEGG